MAPESDRDVNATDTAPAAVSEARYRSLFDHAPDAIFINDGDRVILVNHAAIQLFGATSASELIGRSPFEFFHPRHHEAIRARIARLRDHGETVPTIEEEIVRLDGTVVDVEVKAAPFPFGGGRAIHVILRDVTERNWLRRQLRITEMRTGVIAEAGGIGTFDVELPEGTTYWSRNTFALYGYEPAVAEASVEAWRRIVHPDDLPAVDRVLADALRDHTLATLEHRIRRADDGHIVWLSGAGRFEYDASGSATRYSGFLLDVTVRKRNEMLLSGQRDLLEMIATGTPLPETLEALVRLIEGQAQGMLCSVLLLDPTRARVTTGAAPSLPEPFTRAIEGAPIGPRAGSCGTAAWRGEPVIVEDIATDPLWDDYRAFALPHGLRACWSTPIRDRSREVVGTFAMYYHQPMRPDASHFRLIDVATQIAALAIEREVNDLDRGRLLTAAEEAGRDAVMARDLIAGIVERVSDGFVALDSNWRYTWVNQKAAQLLGRQAPEDLLGRHIWTEYPEGVGQPFHQAYLKASETQETVYFEDHYQPWDRWFENRIYPSPDGLTIYFSEITDRKRAERVVAESAERLRLAIAATNIGLWDWNLITNNVYFSPEWKRQIGFEDHEIGNDFSEWESRVHPDDLEPTKRRMMAFIASPWPVYEVEFRFQHKDGSYRWIAAAASLQHGDSGRPVRMIGCHLDMTERKRAQDKILALNEQLERRVAERTAELESRNRELETFTYSVSHDLKAPLRGIDGYSRLLQEDHAASLDDEGKAFVRTIRNAAGQMGQLIDDLLAYSRLERRPMKPARVTIDGLVASLLAEREDEIKARRVEVRVEIPATSITADAEGMSLALRNLIDNALKFTRSRADPVIEIVAREEERRWILEVSDNGIGFDPKFSSQIFEIFQRLHRAEEYPGTGIGLAIVRKALERMGGAVRVKSRPGEGATFTLEIER